MQRHDVLLLYSRVTNSVGYVGRIVKLPVSDPHLFYVRLTYRGQGHVFLLFAHTCIVLAA